MTTGPLEPRHDPDRDDPDRDGGTLGDPGSDSVDPWAGSEQPTRPGPLDPALDPDRYREDETPPDMLRRLDPENDPDRFQNMTLPELVGKEGAFEDERDNVQWLFGLLAVLAFLGFVAFLFGQVLSPR